MECYICAFDLKTRRLYRLGKTNKNVIKYIVLPFLFIGYLYVRTTYMFEKIRVSVCMMNSRACINIFIYLLEFIYTYVKTFLFNRFSLYYICFIIIYYHIFFHYTLLVNGYQKLLIKSSCYTKIRKSIT